MNSYKQSFIIQKRNDDKNIKKINEQNQKKREENHKKKKP